MTLSNIERSESVNIEKHFKDVAIAINHVIDQSDHEEDESDNDDESLISKDKV